MRILDLSAEAVGAAVRSIQARGPHAAPAGFVCDVADEAAVKACLAQACAGARLYVLVNNAGVGAVGDVLACAAKDMDRLYSVRVHSYVALGSSMYM